MNKNMKYWTTGIIAAIVILAIAAYAAADRGTVVRFGGK